MVYHLKLVHYDIFLSRYGLIQFYVITVTEQNMISTHAELTGTILGVVNSCQNVWFTA